MISELLVADSFTMLLLLGLALFYTQSVFVKHDLFMKLTIMKLALVTSSYNVTWYAQHQNIHVLYVIHTHRMIAVNLCRPFHFTFET